MSSSEALSGLIQALQLITTYYYLDLSVFTVVIYDWILTFPDEIHIMWKRPVTGSKVLFLLNRYLFIADYLTNIMSSFVSEANSRCSGLSISANLFIVLHNLVVSVFQILRVYAISGRMKRYAILIGAFLVFPNFFCIYIWAISTFASSPPPLQGCSESISTSADTYNKLLISERVCLIVSDAIVVVVTILQTYGTVKAGRQANIRSTFSSAVLNAGILYFSVMLVMNTVEFIVQVTTSSGYFADFPGLFDYLMISHFLLSLQEISTITSNDLDPSHPSSVRSTREQMSSVRFADMVIGNLGESLRDGSHDNEDDEDDDADDDGMARAGDIEMDPLPCNDEEERERATLPSSEDDIRAENIPSPSWLPLDVPRNRDTSNGRLTESEIQA